MMRRFLLIGQTGVGKSSFINTTFGVRLAKISDFEACTKVVEHYAYGTPFGDVCLIDTPGLSEGSEAQDTLYAEMIKQYVRNAGIDILLYVSRLDETRFRPTEKRALTVVTTQLGRSVWKHPWLILTFAASVREEHFHERTAKRIEHIGEYIRELAPRFRGFEKVGIVDNTVRNWTAGGIPASQFLAS
jgi:predicted GTPase